ncbi:MAG TPA: hypothetical protein VGR02_22660 [Thermoanaerobaculia bacterium]|nr:hypothetical protein [Thermoanaerobaculia bacterium]
MLRRWLFVYTGWTVICAALFVALRHAPDPSRRSDRIQSNDAGRLALRHLGNRYRGYEAVHVAYAGAGEGAAEKRWVVLCDAVPHTGRGVVVELGALDGRLLRVRPPSAN